MRIVTTSLYTLKREYYYYLREQCFLYLFAEVMSVSICVVDSKKNVKIQGSAFFFVWHTVGRMFIDYYPNNVFGPLKNA